MNNIDQSPVLSKRIQSISLGVGGVGLLLALLGAWLDWQQFWQSYLLAYLFWVEIGLGCLGFLMLHHLVGGRWSALIRHLLESGALTLPLMALLFVPLLLGLGTLYPWANAEHVQQSVLLQQKSVWLNIPFFVGRTVLYFAVWITLTWLLNRQSVAQSKASDPALAVRMRRLSAGGIILYVLTATFAGYDWMMSLEPEWFSSIYGLLFVAGQGLAALALAIIGLSVVARQHEIGDSWVQSFNDLGNFLLGFVMIWAYFSYSQFLVIWSANIPEEAVWYVHRMAGGWQNLALVVIAVQFVLPFVLLLARSIKRRMQWLTALAFLIFIGRFLDLFWLITPAFYPEGLHFHWLDLVLLIAMGGGWLAMFIGQWSTKSPVPIHDPHLYRIGEIDDGTKEFAH